MDIGNLTVGETVTLIITTIAQKEGIIVNNVSVNSTTVDLNMTNNFANATVEANEVIVPSDDSSQSSELGLSQNKNNLLNAAYLNKNSFAATFLHSALATPSRFM